MTITLDRPLTDIEVDADTFLGFEEFGFSVADSEHDKACERASKKCGNQAVFKVWWGPDTDMDPAEQDYCRNTQLLCLACFEHLTSLGGLVRCQACDPTWLFKKIVYSESIR